MGKSLLFIVSSLPYSSGLTEESHDLILASTAYGLEASVLFDDDGVYQLIAEQVPPDKQKNAAKRIKGFEFFDIEPIYVTSEALQQRRISTDRLIDNSVAIDASHVQQLIERADMVIRL